MWLRWTDLPSANSALLKNKYQELTQCIVCLLPQVSTQGDVLTVKHDKGTFVLDFKKNLASRSYKYDQP